ncbi:MAG: hypothetical protein KDD60_10715, partial [Bdellovibrionales bacterium]|nr:hypothetical protein [Bdellovibrionales bacterium]
MMRHRSAILWLFLCGVLLGGVVLLEQRTNVGSSLLLHHEQGKKSPSDFNAGSSLSSNTLKTTFSVTKHRVDSDGIFLFPLSGPNTIYLTDDDGKVLHSWSPLDAARARLLSDCRLLVIHGSKNGLRERRWRELKNTLRIYRRDGSVEWEYVAPEWVHHDVQDLEGGRFVFLERYEFPMEPGHSLYSPDYETLIRSDRIRILSRTGDVEWTW